MSTDHVPTLCPRCIHFTKGRDVGCKIGNFGIEGPRANAIQHWLREHTDASSWAYTGACPSFENNGSSPHLMSPSDQRALRKILDTP